MLIYALILGEARGITLQKAREGNSINWIAKFDNSFWCLFTRSRDNRMTKLDEPRSFLPFGCLTPSPFWTSLARPSRAVPKPFRTSVARLSCIVRPFAVLDDPGSFITQFEMLPTDGSTGTAILRLFCLCFVFSFF